MAPNTPNAKNAEYSRCRKERRAVNGRACCVRYACTTSEYWTVDTRFFFCSFTLGVVSNRHHIRSWLMVFQSKWKDSSAGDTPSLTLIDTVESLRRLDLCLHNAPFAWYWSGPSSRISVDFDVRRAATLPLPDAQLSSAQSGQLGPSRVHRGRSPPRSSSSQHSPSAAHVSVGEAIVHLCSAPRRCNTPSARRK